MTKRYHLVVEAPDGNLSKGIRQLNDLYTQVSNRRYRRTEQVLQGRLKAILADKDSYLFELTRHVVLNPVRAGVTRSLSWRASTRKASGPPGAYATGAYSYREIAAHFALHLATVGRIMRTWMPQGETRPPGR